MKNSILKILPIILPETAPLSTGEKLRSALAAFVASLVVGYVSSLFVSGVGLPFLVASMGASAILMFAVSHSPLSQPWPLIGGNLIPALIAVTCAKIVPDLIPAAVISVALSLLVMQLMRPHPPVARWRYCPWAIQAHELGYRSVLQPVAINPLILLTLGFIINNLLPGRLSGTRSAGTSRYTQA
jgi:CBS-domain-containing membrane protein